MGNWEHLPAGASVQKKRIFDRSPAKIRGRPQIIRFFASKARAGIARESNPFFPWRSIHCRLDPTHPFKPGAVFLGIDPTLALGPARLGRSARARSNRGAANEIDQTLQRVLAIAALRAVTLGDDDQHAVAGHARPRQPLEPRAHVVGQ